MNHLFKNLPRLNFRPCWSTSARFSSATDLSTQTKAKRKNTYVSVANQIYEHFQENERFVANYHRLSDGLVRRRSYIPMSWYCFSDATAETLFQAAKPHLSPGITMIEMSPGFGFLTEKLLSLSPSRLYAFEPDPRFREILSTLYTDCPELIVVPKQFLNISKEMFKEKVLQRGGSPLRNWLPDVELKDWNSEPSFQIIGATAGTKFFNYISCCITFQDQIITYGRPELYLVTTPEIYVKLTHDRESVFPSTRRRLSNLLLFSIYCDVEILCEVDAKSFIPWFTEKSAKEPKRRLVFLRAVPKRDLYDTVPAPLLKPLWFFINQVVLRPKSRVIPFFEKWIPGCGPMFIAKGWSVFTVFKELSPAELLQAFLTFANLPDYEASLFDAAIDSYLFKKDSDAVGDIIEETSTAELVQNDKAQDINANVESVKP